MYYVTLFSRGQGPPQTDVYGENRAWRWPRQTEQGHGIYSTYQYRKTINGDKIDIRVEVGLS